MKKVAFMFVAAMAIAFASCGGAQTKNAEECCDSTAACCDSAAAVAEETVDTLVQEVVDSVAAEVLPE